MWAAARIWLSAYRVEVVLFLVSFAVLASFSSQRFLRQSAAPHFIYQAQSWLEGRLDVDPEVLPNLEDWACVRVVGGSEGPLRGPAASERSLVRELPVVPGGGDAALRGAERLPVQ